MEKCVLYAHCHVWVWTDLLQTIFEGWTLPSQFGWEIFLRQKVEKWDGQFWLELALQHSESSWRLLKSSHKLFLEELDIFYMSQFMLQTQNCAMPNEKWNCTEDKLQIFCLK